MDLPTKLLMEICHNVSSLPLKFQVTLSCAFTFVANNHQHPQYHRYENNNKQTKQNKKLLYTNTREVQENIVAEKNQKYCYIKLLSEKFKKPLLY